MTKPNETLDEMLPKELPCDIHEDMDSCPVIDLKARLNTYYSQLVDEVIGRDLNWTDVMSKELYESNGDFKSAKLQGVQMINDHKIEQRKRKQQLGLE